MEHEPLNLLILLRKMNMQSFALIFKYSSAHVNDVSHKGKLNIETEFSTISKTEQLTHVKNITFSGIA